MGGEHVEWPKKTAGLAFLEIAIHYYGAIPQDTCRFSEVTSSMRAGQVSQSYEYGTDSYLYT